MRFAYSIQKGKLLVGTLAGDSCSAMRKQRSLASIIHVFLRLRIFEAASRRRTSRPLSRKGRLGRFVGMFVRMVPVSGARTRSAPYGERTGFFLASPKWYVASPANLGQH